MLMSCDSLISRVTPGVAAAPHEQRIVERREQRDVLGATGPDRPDRIGTLRVEHGRETGGAALDDLFEHDVGNRQTAVIRDGGGIVVDLRDECRPLQDFVLALERLAGERLPDRRRQGRAGRGRRCRGRRLHGRRGRGRRRRRGRIRGLPTAATGSGDEGEWRSVRPVGESASSRFSQLTVLSAGRSARRAGGGCRTVCGCRPACRRRRRHSVAVRSTSVP